MDGKFVLWYSNFGPLGVELATLGVNFRPLRLKFRPLGVDFGLNMSIFDFCAPILGSGGDIYFKFGVFWFSYSVLMACFSVWRFLSRV